MLESCARMKVLSDQTMTHLNQPVLTPSPNQVQEFHQLPQVGFNSYQEDTQPSLEETHEDYMQLSTRCSNLGPPRYDSKRGSQWATEGIFFHSVSPEPTSLILQHIHFHEVNKFNTLRSNKQIDNHIDMSIHFIEMPFESTPLYLLNRIEELEYQKPVEKAVHVHEVCKLDNDSRCLDKVIRDYMATRTPHIE